MVKPDTFYICLFWINSFGFTNASYKFNSLKCFFYSPEWGKINLCQIKAIDRNHNMMNIEGILNRNITEIEINFKILKRESGGWHPFMYDITMDVCKFFKNRRSFFIANLIYSFLKPFTNVNHTCPYPAGSVLQLWNWTPNENGVLKVFPVDHGQYALHTTWSIKKVPVLKIDGSVLFYK
ncbi:uncharacterized protein Dana_GF18376 [Drosophila ananassae]|uniref:MD-2-related lipid-recognition domain-containing protein n=1 Tax=Drosophila ananassae TaxID=7217 RepID=A0A0P9ARQ0_DROAN|nr:uncharacterized protein LOC6501151 [Drosophila ananassae]KPU80139.1 uncharacterized protein Dana_GF18376 [Drosophila ananassae]